MEIRALNREFCFYRHLRPSAIAEERRDAFRIARDPEQPAPLRHARISVYGILTWLVIPWFKSRSESAIRAAVQGGGTVELPRDLRVLPPRHRGRPQAGLEVPASSSAGGHIPLPALPAWSLHQPWSGQWVSSPSSRGRRARWLRAADAHNTRYRGQV